MSEWIRDALLEECGVTHGFGTRACTAPVGLRRPRQVHGSAVALADEAGELGEADAVVSRLPALPVGIVTADCVPILVSAARGQVVAAIHAGWRGLAAGVVEQGIAALRVQCPDAPLRAAIGPSAGPCCYEVDEPVIAALNDRYADVTSTLRPSRPDHAFIDLGAVVAAALYGVGVDVSRAASECTICAPERFHSYRRDGSAAGRLVHWIAARVG